MGNLNKVMLIGRLTQDPEKKITPAGKPVCNTSMATSDFYKDSNGSRQEKTEFHRLVAWDKTAELLSEYTKKGSQLYVEGSIQTREWKDKDGNRRYTTEVLVRNMQFLDSKKDNTQGTKNNQSYQGNQNYPGNHQTPPDHGEGFIEDDIPF
jgi:single-strand DNA-binding protein